MSPYKYREFNVHGKVSDSYWTNWLERKTTREAATDLLSVVERSGIRWLCIISGYEQVNPISKGRLVLGHFINLIGAITIIRGFFVVALPYDYVQIALGDLFIGSPVHEIQNMLITMLLTLSCGLKYCGFSAERRGPIQVLKLYHRLRSTKFDHKQFMLTPDDCSSIRKSFFFLSYFYLFVTPLTCLAIAAWLTFAFLINPINYESLYNILVIGIWTIVISSIFTLGSYPTIWLYIQNTMIMSYVSFALNSNHLHGQLLVKSESKADQQELFNYFSQQNKIYNFINRSTVDLGQMLSYGIIVVSGVADFTMFVSVFIGTGSDLFNYIIFSVGIMAFTAIVVINILSAFTVVKVSLCHLVNYQIARRCKLNLSTQLKLLATCERMNVNQIGFTLGGIFTMDSHTFLLYLLENAGLMLMFITNFNKSQ
ncbi:uncharacterized protein LOC128390144 [Panonychus citri]|uniref:uncharacterized protein LOC128390144 n=1 Tax=Panonychus citri TaxID=50023 RepID=UPI0023073D36|nr:uncharacterized protein LOC128390144 [Panonychus citri]